MEGRKRTRETEKACADAPRATSIQVLGWAMELNDTQRAAWDTDGVRRGLEGQRASPAPGAVG